jgi:hypothetical protein
MLTATTLDLPDQLISKARDYAQEHHTTFTALVIEQLEAITKFNDNDPLLRFSRGLLTKDQALSEAGLRDYAELLITMGNVDLPIPSLPQEDIDKQVKEFTEMWRQA